MRDKAHFDDTHDLLLLAVGGCSLHSLVLVCLLFLCCNAREL